MTIIDDTIISTTDHTNDGWIPVEERVPDNKMFVLFCRQNRVVSKGYYSPEVGQWNIQYLSSESFNDVIAWRPLPAPYIPPKSELKPVWYKVVRVIKDTGDNKTVIHEEVVPWTDEASADPKVFAEWVLMKQMKKHEEMKLFATICENVAYV